MSVEVTGKVVMEGEDVEIPLAAAVLVGLKDEVSIALAVVCCCVLVSSEVPVAEADDVITAVLDASAACVVVAA